MRNHSKLIAAFIGFVFALLAYFGIGDGEVVLGMTKEVVLGFVTPIATALLVYLAPANEPAPPA